MTFFAFGGGWWLFSIEMRYKCVCCQPERRGLPFVCARCQKEFAPDGVLPEWLRELVRSYNVEWHWEREPVRPLDERRG